MAKRTAASELTDRNWDQEDEPEEAGEFSKASNDTIKTRQIIKAKRRNAGGAQETKTAFSGFGGFSFKPTQTSTPLFGIGGNKTESKIPAVEKKVESDKRPADSEQEEGSPAKVKKTETISNVKNGTDTTEPSSPYLSSLRSLNVSVLNWISQHVEKNPYCILTPIFKDYEKHLADLEKSKSETETNGKTTQPLKKLESEKSIMDTSDKPAPKTGLTFGIGHLNTASSSIGSGTPFPGFSFKPSVGASSAAPMFAVGQSSQESNVTAGTSGSQVASGSQNEEDEYVPPKPESTEHKEEGSIYSKKCKLFYQSDGAWLERGVGHLHLKKLEDKAQLIVRADTSLGNILLNIFLSSSVPLSRSGKNNVSMMCIPNPAIPKTPEGKPIAMLIRVKTGEDADELLEKMKDIQS